MSDGARSPSVGEAAPDFTAPREGGETFHLGDILGQRAVVLYFYPKDDTPGCTAESCGFRDQRTTFAEAGAEVIGVSGDSPESHAAFAAKYQLSFPLVSDGDGAVRRLYGVEPHGPLPRRTTFLIDREGVIRQILSSLPEARQHVEDTLEALRRL